MLLLLSAAWFSCGKLGVTFCWAGGASPRLSRISFNLTVLEIWIEGLWVSLITLIDRSWMSLICRSSFLIPAVHFLIPYFLHDFHAMYCTVVSKQNLSKCSFATRLLAFLRRHWAFALHHVVMVTLAYPLALVSLSIMLILLSHTMPCHGLCGKMLRKWIISHYEDTLLYVDIMYIAGTMSIYYVNDKVTVCSVCRTFTMWEEGWEIFSLVHFALTNMPTVFWSPIRLWKWWVRYLP